MGYLYLHDLWLNWCENVQRGYDVYDFYEWRRDDTIELYEQMPIVKVSTELYKNIEGSLEELPERILASIHNNTIKNVNSERKVIKYAFVLTDGKNVMAVDTMETTIPVKKSRLIPRQEKLALSMVEDLNLMEVKLEEKDIQRDFSTPEPKLMIGLTRKERTRKKLLFMAINELKDRRNVKEVEYWYLEFTDNSKKGISAKSFEDIFELFLGEVMSGWGQKHEKFLRLLIKGQPFYEKLYERA